MTARVFRFLLPRAAVLVRIVLAFAAATVGSVWLWGTEGNFLANYLVAFPLLAEFLFLLMGSALAGPLLRMTVAMGCTRRAAWTGLQLLLWLCWAVLLALSLGMFRASAALGSELFFPSGAVFNGLFLALAGQLTVPAGLLDSLSARGWTYAAGIMLLLGGLMLGGLWKWDMLPTAVYTAAQVVCAGAVVVLFAAGRRLAMRLAPQQI